MKYSAHEVAVPDHADNVPVDSLFYEAPSIIRFNSVIFACSCPHCVIGSVPNYGQIMLCFPEKFVMLPHVTLTFCVSDCHITSRLTFFYWIRKCMTI
uniref:Uncharacterized protein n=1 Tax=Oryza brachyantha TaxID=4533 RepID=J3L4H5_ORYBR